MTHNHEHTEHHQHSARKGIHKDWRVWVAVVLMIGAMAVYVLSEDESIEPAGPDSPPVEAAGDA